MDRSFRDVLARFPTGVVVVAALHEGAPAGFAVNSFTSVSLDPPLVAFCAGRTSSSWPVLRSAGSFTISVLSEDQEEVCRTFARKDADRFGSLRWTPGALGHPRLDGALAWLDCEIEAIHPAGDHELVLGRVVDLDAVDGRPLLFFRGRFGSVHEGAEPAARDAAAAGSLLEGGLDVDSPFFSVLSARLRR